MKDSFSHIKNFSCFKIPVSQKECSIVIGSIPLGTHMLFKGAFEYFFYELISFDVFETIVGKICFFINLQKY